MKEGAEGPGLLSRLGLRLRPAWKAFLRWRREYWQVRAVIVLLLGLYLMLQPNIVKLIDIAIQGIFAGSEPKVVFQGARCHKAMEADRLRRALRAHLRADGDEAARQLGIVRSDLEGRSSDLDLNRLVRAARSAGLVQDSYTARGIRRRALALGRADAEEIFGPARAEIGEMLRGADRVANWSLESWYRTARGLLYFGLGLLRPADWITSTAWLLLCYYACRLATVLGRGRAMRVAPLIPPVLVLVAMMIASSPWWDYFYAFYAVTGLAGVLKGAGWLLLTFTAAYAGSRSVPQEKRPSQALPRALLPVAACLAAWGVLSLLSRLVSPCTVVPEDVYRRPACHFLGNGIPIAVNVTFTILGLAWGLAWVLAILVLSRRQAVTGDT